MMRRRIGLCALALILLLVPSCATRNLVRWSKGEDSIYQQPVGRNEIFVRAGGTVLAFPVAIVWDVLTFPFQWLWGAYPYGDELDPDKIDG